MAILVALTAILAVISAFAALGAVIYRLLTQNEQLHAALLAVKREERAAKVLDTTKPAPVVDPRKLPRQVGLS